MNSHHRTRWDAADFPESVRVTPDRTPAQHLVDTAEMAAVPTIDPRDPSTHGIEEEASCG